MATTEQLINTQAFRRGDAVTVRGLDEILATLDADSKLDGMPFMPEMVPYCGKTFRVYRRADKTCVEGIGLRSMRSTVFLDGLRCNGAHHGGCQRGCLFFWNEAWLRPATPTEIDDIDGSGPIASGEATVEAGLAAAQLPTTKGDRFYCQSTELLGATSELVGGRLQLYLRDIRMGELTLRRFAYYMWMALTNRVWQLMRGRRFHQITGEQKKTLRGELNLQPCELVEVKSPMEIQATLDDRSRNRGLTFEPEMALHCGRRYRVATQVKSIVSEETGKMIELSNTVILDGVACQGICAQNCPRTNFLYWREIWLKRV